MRIAQVMRSHNHFAVPSSARKTITLFAQALALRPHRPPSPQDTSCATSSKQVEHNHMCFPVRIALVCATQWLRITIDLCLHTHNGSYIVVGLSLSFSAQDLWLGIVILLFLHARNSFASTSSGSCVSTIASHLHPLILHSRIGFATNWTRSAHARWICNQHRRLSVQAQRFCILLLLVLRRCNSWASRL